MYYFRDSYFDQQIAYGVARGSFRRARKQEPVRVWHAVSQVLLSLICLFVTFAVAYMVLDVLGLEHLVQMPKLKAALITLDMPFSGAA